jgi:transcription elongation factor Elf1
MGVQRPRPTPAGESETADPQSCPKCGSRNLKAVAQTTEVIYVTCEQCGFLLPVVKPESESAS